MLVLVTFLLTGCSTFDLRKGPGPVLDGTAVKAASDNKLLLLHSLAADAGYGESRAPDWYAVSEAGFNYVDDQCRTYFDNLFFLDRGREQFKSGLNAASQTTAAILNATGATGLTLNVVAQAFGFATHAIDIATGTYLYRLPPATTQGFVEKLQLAFRDGAAANRARINSPTTAYYVIQRYLSLCLPPTIEAEITRQISSTSAAPVPAGGGALFSISTVSVPGESAVPVFLPPKPSVIIGPSKFTRLSKPGKTVGPSPKLCIKPLDANALKIIQFMCPEGVVINTKRNTLQSAQVITHPYFSAPNPDVHASVARMV